MQVLSNTRPSRIGEIAFTPSPRPAAPRLSRKGNSMYCAKCDRWEHDQIAVEDMICLRCYGPLVDPDEGNDEYGDEQQEPHQ